MALLADVGTVDTVTPERFTGPMVRVLRVGGSDDRISDFPRVEVRCFAATRNEAREMSEQCRQLILASSATSVVLDDGTAVFIDRARTDTPPQAAPFANPDIDSTVAYYRFALRRPRQN